MDGRLVLLGLVSGRSCSCYMWHPVVCVLSLYVHVTGCSRVVTVCTCDRLLSVCCHCTYVHVILLLLFVVTIVSVVVVVHISLEDQLLYLRSILEYF